MGRFEKKVVEERCGKFNKMLNYLNENKKDWLKNNFFEFIELKEQINVPR